MTSSSRSPRKQSNRHVAAWGAVDDEAPEVLRAADHRGKRGVLFRHGWATSGPVTGTAARLSNIHWGSGFDPVLRRVGTYRMTRASARSRCGESSTTGRTRPEAVSGSSSRRRTLHPCLFAGVCPPERDRKVTHGLLVHAVSCAPVPSRHSYYLSVSCCSGSNISVVNF